MAIRRAHKQKDAEAKRHSDNPPANPPARIVGNDDGINRRPAAVSSAPGDLPEELIAARAYEIWRQRGCPMGHDSSQDWYAARAELEAERLGWATPQAGDDKRSASK